MYVAVKLTDQDETSYEFYGVDEDGFENKLGRAVEYVDSDGVDGTITYFSGDFDTKGITFENDEQLVESIKRIKGSNVEIEIMDENEFFELLQTLQSSEEE